MMLPPDLKIYARISLYCFGAPCNVISSGVPVPAPTSTPVVLLIYFAHSSYKNNIMRIRASNLVENYEHIKNKPEAEEQLQNAFLRRLYKLSTNIWTWSVLSLLA